MEKIISLCGKWNGVCLDEEQKFKFDFEGTVPGCVHTDLADSVLDYDIFYRDNADKCQWIEKMNWHYSRTFSLDKVHGNEEIVFKGLDVYCDVYLNGVLLGGCDNMFITHTFFVGDKLTLGENKVEVRFRSPIAEVEGREWLPGAFTTERMHTRRMQCTYGWDWVGRFVTCGIYREVFLRIPEGICTKSIYVYTEQIGETSSQIAFEAEFENYEEGGIIKAEIFDPDDKLIYSHEFYVNEPELKEFVDIKNAKLWYPHGYGEQPLYTLKVCDKETKFGIRTVRILQEKDEQGSEYYNKCLEIKQSESGLDYDRNEEFSGFILLVNGVKVMCKGANWVPCAPFPSAESEEKITHLLTLGRECGVNMLRVWGGGLFEKQHFYSECDRLGIMVTQDFLMACGKYPENNADFIEQVRKETVQAALDLRNHPALMWWSGDNENAVLGADNMAEYKGRIVTHKSIIPMLNKYDPRRRFLLSSPYGGNLYASKTVGTTHNTQYLGYIWDYIEKTDMSDYKEYFKTYTARFIAEEPAMGSANLPTLKRFMNDRDIYEAKDMWLYHTKGNPDMRTEIFDYADMFTYKVLGDYKNGADRLFKLKYVHYEWMRISFENARRNKGFCNGLIYWMFNDCWPAAVSWAIVDYYGIPKPAFYSFKRCSKPVVASIIENNGKCEIYVSNDSLSPVTLNMKLCVANSAKNNVLYEEVVSLDANCSSVVKTLDMPGLKDGSVLICDVYNDNYSDRAFHKTGALHVEETNAVKIVSRTEDSITVSANKYVHAVELEGEYLFEDNYFSLTAGETRTISMSALSNEADVKLTGYTLI